DELLSCQDHSAENNDTTGVFATKKELWNKARDALRQQYGPVVPIEIVNRFLTEQIEMQDTDMIVYFDLLSVLASEAKKRCEHIRVRGGTGASLVAYLLGATEINPLKPHDYCPRCLTVIFDKSADDGWDLAPKECSCGKSMIADGHNIPFETYRHVVHRNTSIDVSMSPNFWSIAKRITKDYFKDFQLTFTEREENRIITITVSVKKSECSFTFCADERFERYQALERATGIPFDRVPFYDNAVLREFQNGNTNGIPEFGSDFVKKMLRRVQPKSFRDLIQISGLSHGTGVWTDNADKLIDSGYPVGRVIAYRDDIFNDIQEKMTRKGLSDTGFAYRVMEDTRRGLYAKNGVPDDIKMQLKTIGMEDRFVDSIGKISYLFPKAHGVTYVKLAAILMWYQMHYPKEFDEIMM
ncbi:MAG: hypothetical protein ACI4SP_02525, partial [Eubacteriales bacterium]